MRVLLLGVLATSGLLGPARASDLALRRVMLSSAGVGYFEYEAMVDGPAALGLDVRLDQVDDVLKSLVVFDERRRRRRHRAARPGRDACRLRRRAVRPGGR